MFSDEKGNILIFGYIRQNCNINRKYISNDIINIMEQYYHELFMYLIIKEIHIYGQNVILNGLGLIMNHYE